MERDLVLRMLLVISIVFSQSASARYLQSDPIGVTEDFSDPQMQVAIQHGLQLRGNSVAPGLQLPGNIAIPGLQTPANIGAPMLKLNHLYGYANQSPVNYVDPFGLRPIGNGASPRTKCKLQCWDDYLLGVGGGIGLGAVYLAAGGAPGIAYGASFLGKLGASMILPACLEICDDCESN